MKREIKFRGLRPDGVWVYGMLGRVRDTVSENGQISYTGKYNYLIHSHEDHIGTWPVYGETVGQFTGLRDKNGVEIYEGDILSCKVFIDGKWEDSVEPVIFKEGCFALDWSFSKDGSYWEILSTEVDGKKIIGNIHEKKRNINSIQQ